MFWPAASKIPNIKNRLKHSSKPATKSLSSVSKRVKNWKGKNGEAKATATREIEEVNAEEFDALLIPGGHFPDKLRANAGMVRFVQEFYDLGRPIMAICHGPQLMLAANRYKGYKITAWQTIQSDLSKAGADVVDDEVVSDGQMITSRKPEDIPAFIEASLKALNRIAA